MQRQYHDQRLQALDAEFTRIFDALDAQLECDLERLTTMFQPEGENTHGNS